MHHQVERAAIGKSDSDEMSDVPGDDAANTQALGQSDDGGVHEA